MTYACKDRAPYREAIPMQDGFEHPWLPRIVEVPFRMAPDCQFTLSDLGQVDKRCEGCTHKKETK